MTATVTASSLFALSMMTAALATGRSTLTLLFNMGVMTMKMISSTSITSTMGVTLMLELTFLPSSRLLIPIRLISRPSLSLLDLTLPASAVIELTRSNSLPPEAVAWRPPEAYSTE